MIREWKRHDISGILRQIAELIESGAMKTGLGEVFPLQAAAQAHAKSETGQDRAARRGLKRSG